jgi:hypothetical protein
VHVYIIARPHCSASPAMKPRSFQR